MKFKLGDRVTCCPSGTGRFPYHEEMAGASGAVCYVGENGDYGVDFDDAVGYGHNCHGLGRGGGHSAWVHERYLVPEVPQVSYELPDFLELL